MSFVRIKPNHHIEPLFDMTRGLWTDRQTVHKFGSNDTVPNGSYSDIWTYGATDATYNWPTTAETFRVAAGGNAADTSDGAGARTIQIVYLDGNGRQEQEQLTLAGASASAATSKTATRLIRAYTATAGTYGGNNVGDIVIENTTSNQVVGSISAGIGQTQMSMYTVPLRYTAYVFKTGVDIAAGLNKDADVRMWQRRDALTWTAPYCGTRLLHQWTAAQGNVVADFDTPLVLPELTDVWLEAQGNGSATAVDCYYSLYLVQEYV
jgi:hypothetical protein